MSRVVPGRLSMVRVRFDGNRFWSSGRELPMPTDAGNGWIWVFGTLFSSL